MAIVWCWTGSGLPVKHALKLQDALVREDTQTLAAGVILLTAFMPVVRFSSIAYHAGSAPFLTMIFGLEAVLCLALNQARAMHRKLIWDKWEAVSMATAVRGLS